MPEVITTWQLYMVRCADGSLYTGITTDVERRFAEHQAGLGAKYLRGRQPLQLVYQQAVGSQSQALKLELAVKRLSKSAKEALIQGTVETPSVLASTAPHKYQRE